MPPRGTTGERTYSFVSDPTHTETLSGRVSAACINCRRKKIKCSGEADCQTCREKGLVCEGLLPRSQTKKDQVIASSSSSSSYPSNSRRHAVNRLAEEPAQSTALGPDPPGSFPATDPLCLPLLRPSNPTSFETFAEPSSLGTRNSEDWSFLRPDNTTFSDYQSDMPSSVTSYTSHMTSTPGSFPGLLSHDHSEPTQWWPTGGPGVRSSSDLLSTANALEQQARSLRQLAYYQDGNEMFRRQTIALPATRTQSASSSVALRAWGSVDGTTPGMGSPVSLVPDINTLDAASWWSVDDASMPTLLVTNTGTSSGNVRVPTRPRPQQAPHLSNTTYHSSHGSEGNYRRSNVPVVSTSQQYGARDFDSQAPGYRRGTSRGSAARYAARPRPPRGSGPES